MKDMPVFTTSYGVASLTLREIPYKGIAYIRIQNSPEPGSLLKECIDFCCAVGAVNIYATGHRYLEKFPLHTEIWRMDCLIDQLPKSDASLFPVQEKTLEQWREIYNRHMKDVPNSTTMTLADAEAMLKKGDGYFVHKGDCLLGIGKAGDRSVDVVISVVPGSGKDVLLALCNALSGDKVCVEVASVNSSAVRLYNNMGFIKTAEISRWYKVR